ncbi:MAG: hypothetical protein R3F47_13425 [Gammaproteobacteria bacterium]
MALMSFLSKGGLTGVLPDQQPSQKSGVFVPFFTKNSTDPGPARQTDPAHWLRCIWLHLPCAIPMRKAIGLSASPLTSRSYDTDETVSAAAMNRIETLIRMAPEQYQWEYKRFNKRPDKNERRPYS